jgi:hypothetical protein
VLCSGARDIDGVLKLKFLSEVQTPCGEIKGGLSPEAATAVCFSDINFRMS